MAWLTMTPWSPYATGIGIGLLACLTFLLSNKPLACSTSFARTSGMIEKLFRGSKVAEKPYYQQFPPVVEWQWMLVVGVIIGAFISAVLSGEFSLTWVPGKWAEAFGEAPVLRLVVALVGGVFIGMGARWAGGCTSGHGISGTLQLTLSSWLAVVCFFIGGVATAMLVFHVLAR